MDFEGKSRLDGKVPPSQNVKEPTEAEQRAAAHAARQSSQHSRPEWPDDNGAPCHREDDVGLDIHVLNCRTSSVRKEVAQGHRNVLGRNPHEKRTTHDEKWPRES